MADGGTPDATQRVLALALALSTASLVVCAWAPSRWGFFVMSGLVGGAILYVLWRRGGLPLRWTLGLAAGSRLVAFVLPPALSDDAYRYVWDGLLQHQGINPYRFVPGDPSLAAFQEGPLFELLNSADYFSIYPPLSQMVFFVGGMAVDGGWLGSYYVIKGVIAAAEWGGVLLLARMTDARTLALYALHPLVVVEVAGQGHTEGLMVLLLVLVLWLARRERPGWASAALGAAAMVKLYPLVLFPLLWRRHGGRAVWPGIATMGLLTLPYAAPYVLPHLLDSLRLYTSLFEFNAGLYLGLKQLLYLLTGIDWSKVLGPFMALAFGLTLPLVYAWDARRRWSLAQAMLIVLGLFLVCTTTVHPWYLLAVLPLVVLQRRIAWHWLWLGVASLGTYLLYLPGGEEGHWAFVVLGWGGWAALAGRAHADDLLQVVMRWRARRKAAFLRPCIPERTNLRLLDLGAGEGYVGKALAETTGADVHLVDVLPMNRTSLPYRIYDGQTLPFDEDAFDVTVLSFVLHHSEDPTQVLREALRVTEGPVLVVESVYTSARGLRLLTLLDRLVNRIRSGGRMRGQEPHLHFRTVDGWLSLFEGEGASVQAVRRQGRFLHRQALFVVTSTGD